MGAGQRLRLQRLHGAHRTYGLLDSVAGSRLHAYLILLAPPDRQKIQHLPIDEQINLVQSLLDDGDLAKMNLEPPPAFSSQALSYLLHQRRHLASPAAVDPACPHCCLVIAQHLVHPPMQPRRISDPNRGSEDFCPAQRQECMPTADAGEEEKRSCWYDGVAVAAGML